MASDYGEQPKWEKFSQTQAHVANLQLLEAGAPALKTKLMMLGNPAILQACMDALTIPDEKPVHWMLSFLYDLVREDNSAFNSFEDALKKKPAFCEPLKQIMKSPANTYVADKASWLMSAVMGHCPVGFSQNAVLDLLKCVIHDSPVCSELGRLEAIVNLLKADTFRAAVWADDNVKQHVTKDLEKTAPDPVLYKSVMAVWLLSFDAGTAQELKAMQVVSKLKDILATNKTEKVVRITLTTLKALLPNASLCADIVDTNMLESVQSLEYEKWRDAELYDEIKEISGDISTAVQELSNFDRYENELSTGSLHWGYTHTSTFWAANITKFDKNDCRTLKALGALLQESDSPETLAVACHDIGNFVTLHPMGKKKVAELGIKERIMELMAVSGEEKRELRREALLCCQKIMLNKWQEASKGN